MTRQALATPPAEASPRRLPAPAPGRATVLVVDDTPANLSVLLDLLTGAGFDVLVADSGERALMQVAHRRPDLILLDVLMPGLNGTETCRRLKAQADTRDIPVIFMTALTDVPARLVGFAAGAADYVSKPFDPEEVLARLRVQLESRHRQRHLEAEVNLRLEAEAHLEQSLTQAVLVAAPDGAVVFCTRRARELLDRYLAPDDPVAVLPPDLLAGGSVARPPSPVRLRAHRCDRRTGQAAGGELTVFLLKEEATDPSFVLLDALDITEREAEVLYWVAQGKTSPEIAIILGTALKTVKKHLQRVYEKLGVETRTAAALQANAIINPHASF